MSASYRLTIRALQDLNAIADYTIERWGADQMERYLKLLDNRFEWLAQNPLAGRERNDVHRGYRSFPEGSHVIFYIFSGDYVDVIGVPHKSMDIGSHLF